MSANSSHALLPNSNLGTAHIQKPILAKKMLTHSL